jgi:predicted transcriptional regulator
MRDTLAELLWAQGLTQGEVGKLLGVSPNLVSTRVRFRQKNRCFAKAKLAEFKTRHCEQEIARIKREYDRLTPIERAKVKEQWAAEIDVLLAHYRASFARTGPVPA